jgi:hypothetical protein
MDFFIRAAMEWRGHGLARELAWCDALCGVGKPGHAMARLRAVLREATGDDIPRVGEADTLAAAFVILERLSHVYRPGPPDERAA